jgi:hypothetical protein
MGPGRYPDSGHTAKLDDDPSAGPASTVQWPTLLTICQALGIALPGLKVT